MRRHPQAEFAVGGRSDRLPRGGEVLSREVLSFDVSPPRCDAFLAVALNRLRGHRHNAATWRASRLISRLASKPSIYGIRTSKRTTSNGGRSMLSIASMPLLDKSAR